MFVSFISAVGTSNDAKLEGAGTLIMQTVGIICIICSIIFILIIVRKWTGILSGFSGMSKEEQSQYDEVLITRIVGICGLLIVAPMAYAFLVDVRSWPAWLLIIIGTVGTIIYAAISTIDNGKYLRKKT